MILLRIHPFGRCVLEAETKTETEAEAGTETEAEAETESFFLLCFPLLSDYLCE